MWVHKPKRQNPEKTVLKEERFGGGKKKKKQLTSLKDPGNFRRF
jgi:hypothetical protein